MFLVKEDTCASSATRLLLGDQCISARYMFTAAVISSTSGLSHRPPGERPRGENSCQRHLAVGLASVRGSRRHQGESVDVVSGSAGTAKIPTLSGPEGAVHAPFQS
jgi:hypothetical protein